jgi:hypothetical protein
MASALLAERDEDTCRKAFLPSETVALGRQSERLLAAEARPRRHAGKSADGQAGGRGRQNNLVASGHPVSGGGRGIRSGRRWG